jgi:hypothetical protein
VKINAPYVKLNRADLKTIRETARRLARAEGCRTRYVHIEIGERYNLERGHLESSSINILKVDSTPCWDDSDLFETRPFSWITDKPVELADGRAVLDFYIYERYGANDHGDLVCNMQADLDALGLVRTYDTVRGDLWTR